jgi:putative PIN family toxin of toxin-antitoxin system
VTSAVLDTNVLVSGLIGADKPASTPGALLRRWRAKAFELVISEHILSELADTFTDPYFVRRLSAEVIAEMLNTLRLDATIQPITVSVRGIASHAEDDAIIATALSAQCQYLVTGDKQLQDRVAYRGTLLISPRQFLEFLDRESLS